MVDEKLSRLGKYLTPPWQVDVVLERDKHHRSGQVITCRINIEIGKKVWHAERVNSSISKAIDDAEKAVSRELQKYRDRKKSHRD